MENLELDKRIASFTELFDDLQTTTSRTEKEFMVSKFLQENPDYKDDFTYIFETLDGKHPIGWTFNAHKHYKPAVTQNTIADVIKFCEKISPKTADNTFTAERIIGEYGEFIEPIVNRTLRLGIGKSLLQLDKIDTTPMLAKKFEGDKTPFSCTYVTEKLDGNRCIARFSVEQNKWEFFSRSGKKMSVAFDMSDLSREYIYDGEVMSVEQTLASEKRYDMIINSAPFAMGDIGISSQTQFNETSGLINRRDTMFGKLVYNIFDIIMPDMTYSQRRTRLNAIFPSSPTVRILPTLAIVMSDSPDKINTLLSQVTSMGGEGVMLNDASAMYEHKRSAKLLKYKIVNSMDMMVTDILPGKGKYEGLCGALHCETMYGDKRISCDVGSGLTDYQRYFYARNPEFILHSIIEVGYHEITIAKDADEFSLRFPRFVKIRNDKKSTSIY